LNSDLLTWIQSSKRNKKSFFMMWMNFMCTCSICKMELLFIAIQILNQMVNGMIWLWSNLMMVLTRYLVERNQLECGLTIIFQVRCYVSSLFLMMIQPMQSYILATLMTMKVTAARNHIRHTKKW